MADEAIDLKPLREPKTLLHQLSDLARWLESNNIDASDTASCDTRSRGCGRVSLLRQRTIHGQLTAGWTGRRAFAVFP